MGPSGFGRPVWSHGGWPLLTLMMMGVVVAAPEQPPAPSQNLRLLSEVPVEAMYQSRTQVTFSAPIGCTPEPGSSPADLEALVSGPTGVCLPWTRPTVMTCPRWESECWVAVLPRSFQGTVVCSTPTCSFEVSFVDDDATVSAWWWPPDAREDATLALWLAGSLSEGWAKREGDARVVHLDRAALAALAGCVEGSSEPPQGHPKAVWAVRVSNGMGRYTLMSFLQDRVTVRLETRALRPGCVDAILK